MYRGYFYFLLLVLSPTLSRQSGDQCPIGSMELVNVDNGQKISCLVDQAECRRINGTCTTTEEHGNSSVCCRITARIGEVAAVEPPTGGCPNGWRPLRGANGQTISCTTVSCPAPDRSVCYSSSYYGRICCISDPSEGCPTGTKPAKSQGVIVRCLPTDGNCPGRSFCLWNYQKQTYQCCMADNGCPENSRPLYNGGTPMICNPQYAQGCPVGHRCSFNLWTASYQCCSVTGQVGSCPAGYESMNYPGTNLPLVCGPSTIGHCPAGYNCMLSTAPDHAHYCCRFKQSTGAQCPNGYRLLTQNNNPVMCAEITFSCPMPAVCVGSWFWQRVCCTRDSLPVSCPAGYSLPVGGQTISCVAGLQSVAQCPQGTVCKSNVAGSVSGVCCRSLAQCPAGFQEATDPVTNVVIDCDQPFVVCPVRSVCVQSASTASRLCCFPTVSPPQCPAGSEPTVDGGPIFCSSAGASSCVPPALCVQSITTQDHICCRPVVSGRCPPDYIEALDGSGRPRICSDDLDCPASFQCTSSTGTSSRVCCARPPRCPSGRPVMTGGRPLQCSGQRPGCPTGSSCYPAFGTEIRICCFDNPVSSECPTGFRPWLTDGRPVHCQDDSGCPTMSRCTLTVDGRARICCEPDTKPPVDGCPLNYQPLYDLNKVILCKLANSNPCPRQGFCFPSGSEPISDLSICCTPDGARCPPGFDSGAGAQPQWCDPGQANACGTSGTARCTAAVGTASGGRFLCCQPSPLCTSDRIPFYTSAFEPKKCIVNRPAECPQLYRCEISTDTPGVSVCCPSPSTFRLLMNDSMV